MRRYAEILGAKARLLRKAVILRLLPIVGFLSWAAAADLPSGCDQALFQPPSVENGYRLRSDRCEGSYSAQVANQSLAVISVTAGTAALTSNSGQQIQVAWVPVPNATISIRAIATGFRQYYQMDADQSGGTNSYEWPKSVIAALTIPLRDIAISATLHQPVLGSPRTVYVPLYLGTKEIPSGPHNYTVTIVPGVQLSEVFLTLYVVNESEHVETQLQPPAEVGLGPYLSGRPIQIPIKAADLQPGVYHILVSATQKDDEDPVVTDCWLLDSPRQ